MAQEPCDSGVQAGTRQVDYGHPASSVTTAGQGPKVINVHVHPTTGGEIKVQVAQHTNVGALKRLICSKLKLSKDRIVLLHKNRQLTDGTLEDNRVTDCARLILLPSVEAGLALRPEQSVMQALESLSDTQVDNFLTGRAPLNLTMRLGDHMMFIQLQLSTLSPPTLSKVCTSLPSPPHTPTSPTATPLPFTLVPTYTAPPSPPASPTDTKPAGLSGAGSGPTNLSWPTVVEASRNLTQTLMQLSTAALGKQTQNSSNSSSMSSSASCEKHICRSNTQSGAVIETMYHHGKGVYSGTFSGTLSPSLQDREGRPRRDITTIVHILNDLLGASSQCNAPCSCNQEGLSPHRPSADTKVEVDPERQDENLTLRGKVEHIQTMLEERRQRRKARREVRSAPYSRTSEAARHETQAPPIGSCSSNTLPMDGTAVV